MSSRNRKMICRVMREGGPGRGNIGETDLAAGKPLATRGTPMRAAHPAKVATGSNTRKGGNAKKRRDIRNSKVKEGTLTFPPCHNTNTEKLNVTPALRNGQESVSHNHWKATQPLEGSINRIK